MIVLEVSFEVANKVGGIYTVLESKAPRAVENFGDKYIAIGMFDAKKSYIEFEPGDAGILKDAFSRLLEEGIQCYYGTWKINGSPKCILVDVKNYYHKINEIKTKLWEQFGVDSLHADESFNTPVVWSHACGKLIEKLSEAFGGEEIVAQFHEWLSGAGMLHLKGI